MLSPTTELVKKIEEICRKDGRYKPESYLFVLAGLHFTVSQLPEPRHVTGKELAEGLRIYGLDQFGPLTRQVFEHWGIHTTEDFGHIVFNLVNAKILLKTEDDKLEDFLDLYDFAEAFDPQPLFKLTDG
jgi:uncharacterized repeat protein (TIGR04138 family)